MTSVRQSEGVVAAPVAARAAAEVSHQRAWGAVVSVGSLPLSCACTFERCLHTFNGSSGVVILSVLSCRDESLPGKNKQDYLIIS